MKKVVVFLVLTIFIMLLSADAFAQGNQSGPLKVQSLRFADKNFLVRFNPALSACGGGDFYRMHAMVPHEQENSKELMAALLTAYSSGLSLQWVWFSNEGEPCSQSHVLNLDAIEFSYKQ